MLRYHYTGRALIATNGDHRYRLTGPKASRIYAAARSMDARGCKPTGRRVIGRALNGWYGLTITDDRDVPELGAEGFAAELERRTG